MGKTISMQDLPQCRCIFPRVQRALAGYIVDHCDKAAFPRRTSLARRWASASPRSCSSPCVLATTATRSCSAPCRSLSATA